MYFHLCFRWIWNITAGSELQNMYCLRNSLGESIQIQFKQHSFHIYVKYKWFLLHSSNDCCSFCLYVFYLRHQVVANLTYYILHRQKPPAASLGLNNSLAFHKCFIIFCTIIQWGLFPLPKLGIVYTDNQSQCPICLFMHIFTNFKLFCLPSIKPFKYQ